MIKTRTIPAVYPATVNRGYNPSNVLQWTSIKATRGYNSYEESINTTNSGRNRVSTNFCEHTKFFDFPMAVDVLLHDPDGLGWYVKGNGYLWDYWANSNPLPKPTSANPYALQSLSSLQQQASKTLQAAPDSGLSALNFLHELKDFKRMFARWRKQTKLAQNLVSTHYDPAQSWAKNAAGIHLNYSFNILPNVSDVTKMCKEIMTFERRYNKLISDMRKPVSRRFRTTVAVTPIAKAITALTAGQELWDLVEFIEPPLFCATAHLSYDIPKLSGWTKTFHFLDRFGVNLNPQILWEATPFSFVVDWFVRVGDFLEQFKESNVGIVTNYTDISYSLKYKVKYSFTMGKSGFERATINLRNATYSSYKRWRGNFASPSFTEGQYGVRQGALSASLAIVLIKKR